MSSDDHRTKMRARREAERVKLEAEAVEWGRVSARIDEAAARARDGLLGDVGPAVAAVLDATKPYTAADGYPSIAAVYRSSPEVTALAEAVLTHSPSSTEHSDFAPCGICKQRPGVTIYINDDCPEHGDSFEWYADDDLGETD